MPLLHGVGRKPFRIEHLVSEVPGMRIVSDELWQRVKDRQKVVGDLFDFGQSNRLNGTHRPEYLLSRLLECAECGGPYAISGKDRYSCTNRKKRLPIDDLDGACCGNSKTITRHELEERVLNCIPAAFYGLKTFERVLETMIKHEIAQLKKAPSRRVELEAELKATTGRQKSIIQQISDRTAEGRPRLVALDDQLDELEAMREKLANELAAEEAPVEDFTGKVEKLKAKFNPENIQMGVRRLIYLARNNADEHAKQGLMW